VFDDAGPFSEGVAWVMRSYRVGYIDKNGAFLVQPQFGSWSAELSSFSEGLAGACQKGSGGEPGSNCLWGFIDKTGGWIIPPRYKTRPRSGRNLAASRRSATSTVLDASSSHRYTRRGLPFEKAWHSSSRATNLVISGKVANRFGASNLQAG
jgi:hypothetical protein